MQYGVSIKWLSVTCFEIRCGNLTVVTDPYITECAGTELNWEAVENCDIICLSHSHWDHISDIPRLLEKFSPDILCGEQTARPLALWLNCDPTIICPMSPNLELDFDEVKIRALFGRHSKRKMGHRDYTEMVNTGKLCEGKPLRAQLLPHGSVEYRNYLFTLPNGTKILIWGSMPTVEQYNICKELKPDIAIIQRAGNREGNEEKAAFAAAIGCKILIPHHQDVYPDEDPQILRDFREAFLRLVPDGKFLNPEHGKWMDL